MMKPEEIERASFEIIDREAGPHNFSDQQWCVVRRMIHTTADFAIMELVRFHKRPVQEGIAAMKAGAPIVSDSNMIRSGISVARLENSLALK